MFAEVFCLALERIETICEIVDSIMFAEVFCLALERITTICVIVDSIMFAEECFV